MGASKEQTVDVSQYKIVDIYTGKMLRCSTTEDLTEWLTRSYTTLTEQQEDMIKHLELSITTNDETGIKWYGVACGLEITPKKKARRKRT